MNNAVFNYTVYSMTVAIKVFAQDDSVLMSTDKHYQVLLKPDIKIKTFAQLDDIIQQCIMNDHKLINSLNVVMAPRYEVTYLGSYPEMKDSSFLHY